MALFSCNAKSCAACWSDCMDLRSGQPGIGAGRHNKDVSPSRNEGLEDSNIAIMGCNVQVRGLLCLSVA